MKSSSRGLGWGLMNNSEVLRYPSWVYNSSFSRCLHCFKLMNHFWVSQALSSAVSLPLALFYFFQQSTIENVCKGAPIHPHPSGGSSSHDSLATPVHFTADLRIPLIFLHHLLYSLRICHNIESALSKTPSFSSSGKSNVDTMKECGVTQMAV